MAHVIEGSVFVRPDLGEKNVEIPEGIKTVGKQAFYYTFVETVTVPASVTRLETRCFMGAGNLKAVRIYGKINSISKEAFYGCKGLKEITVPDSVTSIVDNAFSKCTALKTVKLPPNLKRIGKGAFSDCTDLEEIILPDTVETIGEHAFAWCKKLKRVVVPDSVISIGASAFSGCDSLTELSIPEGCKTANSGLGIDKETKLTYRPVNPVTETEGKTVADRKKQESGAAADRVFRYDENISFELPKGYIHRTVDDQNGDTREEICYGKSEDANGDETWEFRANILLGTSDNLEGYTRNKDEKILDFYKRGMENTRFSDGPAAPDTAVYAIRRPIRVFGTLMKFKVDGIASVIDQDHLLILQAAVQQDEDNPDSEIRVFKHLMTVGNSIRINGKAMDFSRPDPKKLVKELKFSYDEESDESSLNLGLDVKVKNADGEETDAGTISISGMPDEGKRKVTVKKTGKKKKRAYIPIEQEGNRLIFGGCWSMELVSNCRLDRDPLDDESTGKQYVIKSGTRDIWEFIIADDKDNQTVKSAVSEISQGVMEKMHDAQSIIDLELRSDDNLKVVLHASIAGSGFSCAMVKVETPDGDTYTLTSVLPDIDDIGEAMKKLNNNELGLFHPFGIAWETQWTLMMRMVASIRSLDDPEPNDENWVIGGYEYALNPEQEIIPGVRCRIPKNALKIDDNTYALTEFGLDKKMQVSGQNILMVSFYHTEREEPFDKQSSEPHNRLMITHLGKGFASVLREKRTEGFHACLGYIPLGVGKFVISMMNDQLIAQIIINCGEQEDHPIQYEAMECARKLFDSLSCGSMEEEPPAVFPPTPDYLHEHYDLVTSGQYTTHRDADFRGQSIRGLMEKCGTEGDDAYNLLKIDGDTYTLDQEAVKLAKVFRLNEDLFDPYNDTEALIRKGMFKDARSFEALRSLAWTVSCMADRSGRAIGEYSFEELDKIGELVAEKNYLNYSAFSYMPGLCDHYDWHVFYVPDEYMRSEYQGSNDLRYLTGKENRGGNSVSFFMPGISGMGGMNRVSNLIGRNEETLESLEALRKDLEDLLPVMRTIHDGLLDGRDRSEKPEGVLADALTAWCSLAVAAKEPFYSEEAADTPEADAGLEGPLERPTDKLDDQPAGNAKAAAKKTVKTAAKPAAKPATPAGEVLDLGGETVIKPGQFAGNMSLKQIVIPEGVTEIGNRAFYSCMSLETVVLPKTLRKIDDFAFMSCRSLKKVELQEGIEEIGNHAFGATNSLKQLRLPDSLEKVNRTIFGIGGDSPYATAYLSGDLACRLTEEHEKANGFGDALYARHYVIDGVGYESLSDYMQDVKSGKVKPRPAAAPAKKAEAKAEEKPAEVKTTAKKPAAAKTAAKKPAAKAKKEPAEEKKAAKSGTKSAVLVTEGKMEESAEADQADKKAEEMDCRYTMYVPKDTKLTSEETRCMKIIAELKGRQDKVKISDVAYEMNETTEKTKEILLGLNNKNILKWSSSGFIETVYSGQQWTPRKTKTPAKISIAGPDGETGTKRITGFIVDPDGGTVITEEIAHSYIRHKNLIIPEGVTEISKMAFYWSEIETVIFPKSLRKIGEDAFRSCHRLRSVTIQDGLETIGKNAFSGCPSLKDVTLPDSILEVDKYAFWSPTCNKTTIHLSSGLVDRLYKSSNYPSLSMLNGKKFEIDGKIYDSLITYKGVREAETSYVKYIPGGVALTLMEKKCMQVIAALLAESDNVKLSQVAFEMNETSDGIKKILQGLKDKEVLNWTSSGKITDLCWWNRKPTDTVEIIEEPTVQKPAAPESCQAVPPTAARTVSKTEYIQPYDSMFGFVLPNGYSLEWETGEDFKRTCYIRKGPYYSENGKLLYRFGPSLSVNTPEDINPGESAIQALHRINPDAKFATLCSNPRSELMVKAVPLNILGRTVQMYAFWLIVEKNTRQNFMVSFIGPWDDDRPKQLEVYRGMIDMVNAIRINGKALPVMTMSAEELMRKMPPEVGAGTQTIRGNVQLNINVNGKQVAQRNLYADDDGTIHNEAVKRKVYTVDMLPPGQDEPEKMVAELNSMDPDQAEKMLNALIALNDLNKELSGLNEMLKNGEEENTPASASQPAQPEYDDKKQHQRNALNNRIRALEKERDGVTGLFGGMKRKKIQREIDDLKDQLRRL